MFAEIETRVKENHPPLIIGSGAEEVMQARTPWTPSSARGASPLEMGLSSLWRLEGERAAAASSHTSTFPLRSAFQSCLPKAQRR